jgi:hypothetical protein
MFTVVGWVGGSGAHNWRALVHVCRAVAAWPAVQPLHIVTWRTAPPCGTEHGYRTRSWAVPGYPRSSGLRAAATTGNHDPWWVGGEGDICQVSPGAR